MLAIFDESGDTGQSENSSRHLIIAGVVCNNITHLQRLVTQTRKGLHRKQKRIPEVKGQTLPPKLTKNLLANLALQDVEIYAAILDKALVIELEDREEAYRLTYIVCVNQVLARHPKLAIITDQRYNAQTQRDKFRQAILEATAGPGINLSITMADSQRQKAIQVADTVAWGFFQKHERGDDSLCQIIASKILAEVSAPIKKAGSTWGV